MYLYEFVDPLLINMRSLFEFAEKPTHTIIKPPMNDNVGMMLYFKYFSLAFL